MNNGYKFSIWLVPINWKVIKKIYKMEHIPHITVATNIDTDISSAILNNNIYTISDFSIASNFDKMYKNDPLNGYGFFCKINEIKTNHVPHMTLFYNKLINNINPPPPPNELKCKLYIADTRNLDYRLWTAKNLHQ